MRGVQLRAMKFPVYKLSLTDAVGTPPFWTILNIIEFDTGERMPMVDELLAHRIISEEATDEVQWVGVHAVETKHQAGPPYPVSSTEFRLRSDLLEYICAGDPARDLQYTPRVCKQALLALCHRETDLDEVVNYMFA